MVLEKTLESVLDCKEIQPVHSKEDQPWVFFGRNDAKAETPVLWPPHVKSWLIGKDSDAGRDWGQEKGTAEDEMAGWHHWLDGHEFGWTPEVGDGQGGLACCNSWGRKESDTTEWLNWTELKTVLVVITGGGDVLTSFCGHNKLPQMYGLEQYEFLILYCRGQKSEIGPLRLKSRCWQGHIPSEGSRVRFLYFSSVPIPPSLMPAVF